MKLLPIALLVAVLLSGCKRDAIESYEAPKEAAPVATFDPNALPSSGMGAATTASVTWDAAPGWTESDGHEMRLGSYSVTDEAGRSGDLSITMLPGPAGGPLQNLNRWRGQLQLAPWTEAEMAAGSETVQSGLRAWTVVYFEALDASVQPPAMGGPMATAANPDIRKADESEKLAILGGLLSLPANTWFVKLTGPAPLLKSQQQAFVRFLASFRMNTATAPPKSAGAPFHWGLPEAWTEETPGNMLLAQFAAPGGVTVTVSAFPGDVGGAAANVNRWRGQLGLAPLSEEDVAALLGSIKTGLGEASFLDHQEAAAPAKADARRQQVAFLFYQGQTVFVKMTGPNAAIESQDDAFASFLLSLHSGEGHQH